MNASDFRDLENSDLTIGDLRVMFGYDKKNGDKE